MGATVQDGVAVVSIMGKQLIDMSVLNTVTPSTSREIPRQTLNSAACSLFGHGFESVFCVLRSLCLLSDLLLLMHCSASRTLVQ